MFKTQLAIMNLKFSPEKLTPYVPKIGATIVYFLCTGLAAILFAARNIEALQFRFLLALFPAYHTHISNFSISFLLVLVAGYSSIMMTKKLSYSIFVAFLIAMMNIVYELYVPILNTPDIIDAYYGVVGSFSPLIYLVFYQKYGLKQNPLYNTNQNA